MSTDRSLSEAILAAVADREGVDPTELATPLYDAIDPDALDRLFRNGTGRVTIEYLGYYVTIDQAGQVEIDGGMTD